MKCKNPCKSRVPSEGLRRGEPMFDTRKNFSTRVANAVDLTIDFATLGEYGLEPVDSPARPCEARRRAGSPRPGTRPRRSARRGRAAPRAPGDPPFPRSTPRPAGPGRTRTRPSGRLGVEEEPAATYSPR